ncbi:NADPH:quinone oxidoreductase family protein [Parasphingopyxis lamellibrachiae]|uniref:NADPH:quinone reductase-like Zn-dependent oxidoreductase n=1 Tax=Parasphingopyxis lamellibrachiae TaxID=680125 RepID=A0A3D9FDQ1_9SPHN|nr:NADPH:quinone oxidoreductase family protein [Parasphingopyxis lamellibrachiae]RED15955.1 NADPH:quinone reductase-like Zn-dependent oxidoreductase [Parasphingopyxis lamellibrachiae]
MVYPAMMRTLQVVSLTPDFKGCAVAEVSVPRPGPGQALLRVKAAALGFPDLLMTEGKYQHRPELPFTPGNDIAGEIVAFGGDDADFAVGDAVVATLGVGGFGEYALCPIAALRRKPEAMTFEAAAAFGVAYLTAYVSLVRCGALQPDEWLLVHGAAGGVGLAAVDLGRALGARVIAASASDEKLATIAREYQPDAAINVTGGFREAVKEITGGGADVIYDPVGGDIFDESTRCIAFGGRLLVIGFASGRIATVPTNIPLIKGFSVVGVRAGEYGRRYPERGVENFDAIWTLAEAGRLKPHVHTAVPLSGWREAFGMMRTRQVVGRVIIKPGE